jgi:hypothetical protein
MMWRRIGQVACAYDCGNEPSGSIKRGGISCLEENRLASKEELCLMENNVLILACCGKGVNVRSVLGQPKFGNHRSRLAAVL